jgi:hypothetical protein
MLTKPQTIRSSVPGARPAVGSQAPGVLYVNYPDKQLGVIDPNGVPIDLIPEAVQGPSGPPGPQGEQGPPGADSTVPGPQGEQGPAGPTAVSSDLGNASVIGSDGLVFTPEGVLASDLAQIALTGDSVDASFVQSGSGAVVRTALDKMREVVSVKDFGAIGDAVADDTAAIRNALASMASIGGELLFPHGVYRVTSKIKQVFAGGVAVNLVGHGAKIDGRSVRGNGVNGDTILIELGGSIVSQSQMAIDAAIHTQTLVSSGPFGASKNDVLLLTSTEIRNPARPYYIKGEFVEVGSVSGNTINVTSPIFDDYTATMTTINRVAMPSIRVEGLEIEMDTAQVALAISYAKHPVVTNTIIHGARYTGVQFFYCYGGGVHDNHIYDAWVSGSDGYCVCIASCQGVSVASNMLTQARHCIATGGTLPTRLVSYSDNTCLMHHGVGELWAIDVHGNCEFISITNNVTEGILAVGTNIDIIGNTIKNARAGSSAAVSIILETDSAYCNIKDNSIFTDGVPTAGIWVSAMQNGKTLNNLAIQNNTIISEFSGVLLSPRNSTIVGMHIQYAVITGNVIKASSGHAFYITGDAGQDMKITNLISSDNLYSSHKEVSFLITDNADVSLLTSSSDNFHSNKLDYYCCYFSGKDIKLTNPNFDGNAYGAGNSLDVRYNNTGTIQLINPTYRGLNYRANIQKAVEFLENGATGDLTPIINASGARLITTYTVSGNAISALPSVPTTGKWNRGDRVHNSAPSQGLPRGWVCTVTGTPGTWVSEGNL